MSVIVKGMKMPENCWECLETDLNIAVSVFGGMCPYCEKIRTDHNMKTGRHPECPLGALPDKHGDLIDRDAFRADYGMNADCADCEKECRGKTRACEYDRIYSKMDFCSWIDDADTIVEAEGEE
jgi:hypothetical protein